MIGLAIALAIILYEPLYHAPKYGNCMRLLKIWLKIKSKLKIVFFFLVIKSGRILDIFWAFLIKQLFHSRLLDMR